MRKSLYLKLDMIFGTAYPTPSTASFQPSLRFNDGHITHYKKGNSSCIEQEFKGKLGYLHQYDLVLQEPTRIPVHVTQKDIYVLYAVRATGSVQLYNSDSQQIMELNRRRATYVYLPPGDYILDLESGQYQLFGFYFEVGIFDDGADKDFEFLKPLLESYINDSAFPLTTIDFPIGLKTALRIREICTGLKRGDLDHQVTILQRLKELIKLSQIDMDLERYDVNPEIYYIQSVKEFIEQGTIERGILLDLALLTEIIPLSLEYINRIFKKRCHFTLNRYKKHCIVENAKTQLTEGEPVWSVSVKFHFTDTRSFRRLFKQFTGLSPQAYQKQHIDQNIKQYKQVSEETTPY